ncbi:hypothetical protein IL306_008783 [Fusarium sp. DS 682]|nr:hypothetical protein IL306_008783 [Fusarium sp. DS 682]
MGVSFVKLLACFLVGAVLASPPHFRDLHNFRGVPTPFSKLSPSALKLLFPAYQLGEKTGTEEHKTKDKTHQVEDKTEHDPKHPETDGHKYVSLDGKEASEEERELLEKLLELLTEPKGEIPDEMASGHTQIVDNPMMMPFLWRDPARLFKTEVKDEDKGYDEEDRDSDSDSDDEEEEGKERKEKKKEKKGKQKRGDKNEKGEEKPYLWPKHNRPKFSADEASATDRHEKAQRERKQKVDVLRHELQKEMDKKLQWEESRLKQVDEMKFNASTPGKDE